MEDVGGEARSGPAGMPDLVRGFMTVIAREAVKDLPGSNPLPYSRGRRTTTGIVRVVAL